MNSTRIRSSKICILQDLTVPLLKPKNYSYFPDVVKFVKVYSKNFS